jgi:hypothetical protein
MGRHVACEADKRNLYVVMMYNAEGLKGRDRLEDLDMYGE